MRKKNSFSCIGCAYHFLALRSIDDCIPATLSDNISHVIQFETLMDSKY
jgi:hypothetical protein